MRYLVAIAAALFFALPAHAEKTVGNIAPKCAMQEQVSLSISFNLMADSFTQAKAKYDERMRSISEYAKKQNMKKFELQSLNYNINSNYNNSQQEYQLSGSAGYQVGDADEAFKLAEFLTQQKFNVSVNGNSYKNGMCANNIENRD